MSTTDADQISTFLKECNLLEFKEELKEEGVTRVEDIEDLTEETLKKLGLTSTQAARLKRKFAALPKAVSANSGEASASNSLLGLLLFMERLMFCYQKDFSTKVVEKFYV